MGVRGSSPVQGAAGASGAHTHHRLPAFGPVGAAGCSPAPRPPWEVQTKRCCPQAPGSLHRGDSGPRV